MKNWYYKILHSPVGLIILIGNNEKVRFKLNRVLGVSFYSEITLKNFLLELKRLKFVIPESLPEKLKNCDSNDKLKKIIEEYFSENSKLLRNSNMELNNIAKIIENYFVNKSEISIDNKMLEMDNLTNFYKKVLTTLIKVPFGKTVSYSQLAKMSGYPKAQRAVGTVMSKNPFPILIPCHRVIRSDGRIGEFALGKDMKIKLLEHEEVKYK